MPNGKQVTQVTSDIFVGRAQELTRFREILASEKPVDIFNIHTNGDGGVGKTQLVLRMREECRQQLADRVVAADRLIDFYDTHSRTKIGVMQQIAENLDKERFAEFDALRSQFQAGAFDPDKREELLKNLYDTFLDEYKAFANTMQEDHKSIVLFFDTYEFIQGSETSADGSKSTEATDFCRWLETELFESLAINTCIVVSGRYPLTEVNTEKLALESVSLAHFAFEDTKAFWRECFEVETDQELIEEFGTEELLETFHVLADGRPILLALFADWIRYEDNPLTPQLLLSKITSDSHLDKKVITQDQKNLFEKTLVDRVGAMMHPEDRVILYLAIAYRRMTPEMLHFLIDEPLDTCRKLLLEKLSPLSFIKYKEGGVVLLHDEMRRLVAQHLWDAQDPARESRQKIAQQLITYYDEHFLNKEGQSETDRETYTSERLEYTLLADRAKGISQFNQEFDAALDNGNYDYCDLLLREIERYALENKAFLPFPEILHVRLRRANYHVRTYSAYTSAIRLISETLRENEGIPEWEDSELLGHFLMAQGSAYFSLEQFTRAEKAFLEAKEVFYELGQDYWQYRAANWIGYTNYRQGKFKEAEDFLNQAREGFYRVLSYQKETESLDEQRRRQLFQGLQLVYGNLAILYSYTGKFERAVRKAEITLNITRVLKRNNLEIARACSSAGYASAVAGDVINAHRYLQEAEDRLEESPNRLIQGRTTQHLAHVEYRVDEFAYLLEYYRAEEIEELLKEKEDLKHKIHKVEKLLQASINTLASEPPFKKEVGDAYFLLGELYMIEPAANHWQKAEKAFIEGLRWARASQFVYRVVDILESLITLYYFWGEAEHQEKIRRYEQELQALDIAPETYPELFGKYEITSGDRVFDIALRILRNGEEQKLDEAVSLLKEAFEHYVTAIELLQPFNETRYYIALRVFYNRLRTLLNEEYERKILLPVSDRLPELRPLWANKKKEVKETLDRISEAMAIRTLAAEDLAGKISVLEQRIQDYLIKGNFGLVSLLTDCIIRLYRLLSDSSQHPDEDREHLILHLNFQAGYHRALNDYHQAENYLQAAEAELAHIHNTFLKEGLEGYLYCTRGTLTYRRGEYGRLLETYLQDELMRGRSHFDKSFPGAREEALGLLRIAEDKSQHAVAHWEQRVSENQAIDEKKRLDAQLKRHYGNLGETRFRIGELCMLNEQHEEALAYLRQAISDSQCAGTGMMDRYYYYNSMQSYINALYFAGKYDDAEHREERQNYEKELVNTQAFPSIMARLKIIHGDVLFSQYFQQQAESGGGYRYILKGKQRIRTVRTMWRHYVEACNFMAQHSSANFAAAVRVLLRRIQLIADPHALQVIRQGLRDVWNEQEYLKDREEELRTLVQFANIRSIMLEYENND